MYPTQYLFDGDQKRISICVGDEIVGDMLLYPEEIDCNWWNLSERWEGVRMKFSGTMVVDRVLSVEVYTPELVFPVYDRVSGTYKFGPRQQKQTKKRSFRKIRPV